MESGWRGDGGGVGQHADIVIDKADALAGVTATGRKRPVDVSELAGKKIRRLEVHFASRDGFPPQLNKNSTPKSPWSAATTGNKMKESKMSGAIANFQRSEVTDQPSRSPDSKPSIKMEVKPGYSRTNIELLDEESIS